MGGGFILWLFIFCSLISALGNHELCRRNREDEDGQDAVVHTGEASLRLEGDVDNELLVLQEKLVAAQAEKAKLDKMQADIDEFKAKNDKNISRLQKQIDRMQPVTAQPAVSTATPALAGSSTM